MLLFVGWRSVGSRMRSERNLLILAFDAFCVRVCATVVVCVFALCVSALSILMLRAMHAMHSRAAIAVQLHCILHSDQEISQKN